MERNEAIEVVKRNYPHVTESGSQFETALRTLIPELKESEDEKIRQYLIKCFTGTVDCAPNIKGKDVLAWLEKQGEQKSAWSEEDKNVITAIIAALSLFAKEKDAEGCFDMEITWLNSLKERYTWKPSLAQMNALSIVSKGNAPDDMEAIVSLYNDLKKHKRRISYESKRIDGGGLCI